MKAEEKINPTYIDIQAEQSAKLQKVKSSNVNVYKNFTFFKPRLSSTILNTLTKTKSVIYPW